MHLIHPRNALNIHILHKTLLKSLQKHRQMVFSRFLATTIFVPAENTPSTLNFPYFFREASLITDDAKKNPQK
jgi:hypothetical protein